MQAANAAAIDSMGKVPTPLARHAEKRAEITKRLFDRLEFMYGSLQADMWINSNPETVRAAWTQDLWNYSAEIIGEALELLKHSGKAYPPTMPEFLKHCNAARDKLAARHQPNLALPKPDYSQEAKERNAALQATFRSLGRAEPGKQWAFRALAAHENGTTLLTHDALATVKAVVDKENRRLQYEADLRAAAEQLPTAPPPSQPTPQPENRA